ncbi:MAG: hypothetical protein KKC80_02760 [Candidatus Margulisbacteria bacterium]|nr:hypothetical protein [Candidatus Margulisiibacteriota bacterium]MBU1616785.1 hypothetical protein [Candidatus Margulisiibacteriota bacterium]MBU1867823.1 hypothetical protein [Candidatus Margulisiibacteriota bacterium]
MSIIKKLQRFAGYGKVKIVSVPPRRSERKPGNCDTDLPFASAKYLAKLYFDGQLEPRLDSSEPEAVLKLALRPDFKWNIMVKKVAELAADGNRKATAVLDQLSTGWDDRKLEVFANTKLLPLVLAQLPPRAIISLPLHPSILFTCKLMAGLINFFLCSDHFPCTSSHFLV